MNLHEIAPTTTRIFWIGPDRPCPACQRTSTETHHACIRRLFNLGVPNGIRPTVYYCECAQCWDAYPTFHYFIGPYGQYVCPACTAGHCPRP